MIQQQEAAETLVAHANVASGELVIWLESSSGLLQRNEGPPVDEAPHPFALSGEDAARRLSAARIDVGEGVTAVAMVALPRSDRGVAPSAPLARVFGRAVEDFGEPSGLGPVRVEGWAPEASRWAEALDALLESEGAAGYRLICAPSVAFFARAAMFGLHLLAQQRFVPMLYQDASGHLSGAWAPWLSDSTTAGQVASFVKSMPPSARAAIDECDHDAWRMFDSFVSKQVDAIGRRALAAEDMHEVVEDLDTDADAQVAWASSLLTSEREIKAPAPTRTEIARRVRRWIGVLEERGKSSAWRLLLRLNEPIITGEAQADGEAAGDASAQTTAIDLADAQPDAAEWSISFHLQSVEHEDIVVDAADVWMLSREAVSIQGLSLEAPQELLLGELARAARVYKKLEGVLDDNEPIEMILETEQAYAFLREQRPLLIEQGFGVESPGWWSSPAGRLGVRLKIDSDPVEAMMDPQSGGAAASGAQLGLSALVGYHWEIAIGDTTLTLHEFEKLASKGSPLVRVNGRWVEIRPEDVQAAIKFIGTNPGGEMKLAEAMRLAYASDARETGLPVLGLEATGWVASIFGETPGLSSPGAGMGDSNTEVPTLETPSGFRGTLRPYQLRGLSWLAFLERVGFGACLADDMGLGKTIQLLALLARDRDAAEEAGTKMPPTLLVAPMSVIGNWLREAKRFTPDLKVLLHHGAERAQGDELIASVMAHDMVVTTYALAHRDAETLSLAPWARVVLDEAQFIKNPAAKQSVAV
ncbi:MAG: hypothetical protein CMJ31_12380, partial [Phycisphaerae bacterium]|nr:hypothetical protein [Phycisphaerae bacterium]